MKAKDAAPQFEARAAGSSMLLTLNSFSGRKAVLMFHGSSGAGEAVRVNRLLRRAGYTARELVIASIVDLSAVPLFARAAVEGYLFGSYRMASAELPEGADPAEYVIILPDWKADIMAAFGASRTAVLDAFLVDETTIIEGRYQLRELPGSLLEALQG